MKKELKEFLDGLTELSLKTGVTIGGCGCCGSPYTTNESIKGKYSYNIIDDDVEDVCWDEYKES
jgi:hypothetical protein